MGYSMGGSVAIALLARVPSRFTSVILGGAGIPDGAPDLKFSAAVAAALMTDDLSTITDPTALFFRQFAESRAHDPKNIASLDPDLHALAAVAKRSHGLRSALADHVAAVPRVNVPVLAVVGDKDGALVDAQRLQATLPSTQLVAIPTKTM